MSNHRNTSLQAARKKAIDRGREALLDDRFKTAAENLTKAIVSCPCSVNQKRAKCQCKKYHGRPGQGKPYAFYEELMKSCSCGDDGRLYSGCDDPIHIQALLFRAAVFEATNHLPLSQRDAEWAIELNPHHLESYLRLWKTAMKLKDQMLAWQVACAGVKTGRKLSMVNSEKFKKLLALRDPHHLKFFKQDPFTTIRAPELMMMIFGYLDTAGLCAVLRVSKTWHQYLTTAPILWRNLYFRKSRIPGMQAISRLMKYCGQKYRSLTIEDTKKFGLDVKQGGLFSCSRHLTDLTLHGSPLLVRLPAGQSYLSSLTRLTVVSFSPPGFYPSEPSANHPDRFVTELVRRNAGHLEYLDIRTDHMNFGTGWPVLPKLLYARIDHSRAPPAPRYRWALQKLNLMRVTMPNLRQLWYSVKECNDIRYLLDISEQDEAQINGATPGPRWTELEGLVLSKQIKLKDVLPELDGKIRFLHQLVGHNDQYFYDWSVEELLNAKLALGQSTQPVVDSKPFSSLETLRAPLVLWESPQRQTYGEGMIPLGYFSQLVGHFARLGTLKTMELRIELGVHHDDVVVHTCPLVSSLRSVRTLSLGLYGQGSIPGDLRTRFPKMLAEAIVELGQLETLELYYTTATPVRQQLAQLAGTLLECIFLLYPNGGSPIKTVYSNIFSGVELDMARNVVCGNGATMHPTRIPPPPFPLPIEAPSEPEI